jgi:hypothetical protein
MLISQLRSVATIRNITTKCKVCYFRHCNVKRSCTIVHVFEDAYQLPEVVTVQAKYQVPVLDGGRDLTCSIVPREVLYL